MQKRRKTFFQHLLNWGKTFRCQSFHTFTKVRLTLKTSSQLIESTYAYRKTVMLFWNGAYPKDTYQHMSWGEKSQTQMVSSMLENDENIYTK